MKTENKKLWTLLVIFAVISFCGCLGGGPTETTTTTGEKTTTTTTLEEETTTQQGISLENIFNLGKPSGYTVVYDITTSAAGETTKMTQTQYMSGEKFRMDTLGSFEGEELEMRAYNIPKGTYVCTKTEDEWNCIGGETEEEADYGFDLEDMTSEIEGDITKPVYDGTQVIAGVTAQCFKMTTYEGIRYCVHPNHYIPLLVESIDYSEGQEGHFKMIATSFTLKTPDDSVFTLPAEPMDLSDICKNACMQMPEEYRDQCLANC